tara:strand:- start:6416 stop:7264 length:849 start_codon:yes stop_codon:yes gene_type:complete
MIVEKKIDNFNMTLDISDGGISRVLYTVGGREKLFMSMLRNTIKPGMTCVDLGANIGYTTLYMLEKVGPDGQVYAIEPDQHNIDLLTKNVNNNSFENICEIERCAISSADGNLDFWIASQPNLNSVKRTKHSIRKEVVNCYTLETFLKNKKYPNFIKMDVEGHEVKILEGAYNYFKNNEGTTSFLIEVHPHYYDEDNNFAEVIRKYFKIGFKPKYAVSTPVAKPKIIVDAGYEPVMSVKTDGFVRGLYKDMKEDDFVNFSCYEHKEGTSKKVIRSIMLSREV